MKVGKRECWGVLCCFGGFLYVFVVDRRVWIGFGFSLFEGIVWVRKYTNQVYKRRKNEKEKEKKGNQSVNRPVFVHDKEIQERNFCYNY